MRFIAGAAVVAVGVLTSGATAVGARDQAMGPMAHDVASRAVAVPVPADGLRSSRAAFNVSGASSSALGQVAPASAGGTSTPSAPSQAGPTASTKPQGACTLWIDQGNESDVINAGVLNGLVSVHLIPESPPSPELDLTSGSMSLSGSTLVVRIHVSDMEEEVPAGYQGMRWFANWNFNGAGYSAIADYSTSLGASFTVATPSQVIGHEVPVSGTLVDGPQGYAEIDVPLALVGAPPVGATLQGPTASSIVLLLDDSVAGQRDQTGGGGIGGGDVAGPDHNYVVGQGCG